MKHLKDIKQKRAESLLLELLNEALSILSDSRLNSLCVVNVILSKGKYDAKVFLDSSSIPIDKQQEILKQLKAANGALKEYCLQATNWFRCPKLHFEFDNFLEQEQRIDFIFAQIAKERQND